MGKDRQGVTVHTMNPVHRRGLVLYASLPCDTGTSKGHGINGEEARHRLVSTLWDYLVAMNSPLWTCCLSFNRAAFPIQVARNALGKPYLLLGAQRGPAISFSEGGGKIWAALCGDECDMGIDVAEAVEFEGEYPFHRVFNGEELEHVLSLTGGNLAKAASLLWSVKEAVVKALGCAFHVVHPLQVHVHPPTSGDEEFTFPVRLSGKARARFPINPGVSLWARSVPRAEMWLSIAILERRVDMASGRTMRGACLALAAARRAPQWQPRPTPAGLRSSQSGDWE